MDDEQIFGITKLKRQVFSLAALEMILWDIFVSQIDDGASRSLHDKHQGMSNFVLRNQIVTLFVTQNSESEFRERFRLLEFLISSRKSRSDQGTSRSRLDA